MNEHADIKGYVVLVGLEQRSMENLWLTLRKMNFDVKSINTAAKALEAIKQDAEAGLHAMDFIFLNETSPELENLSKWLTEVRKIQPEAHIVTAFNKEGADSKKIKEGEDKNLHQIFKPLKVQEILDLLEKVLGHRWGVLASEEELDENYVPIPIGDFMLGKFIDFPIFIRMSSKKYVQLARKGSELARERVLAYKNKGVNNLFVSQPHFKQYVQLNINLSKALASPKVRVPKEKKIKLIKHSLEVITKEVIVEGIDAEKFEMANGVVGAALDVVTESQDVFNILDSLIKQGEHLYAHSLGVSMYSTMLARELDWNTEETIFKLSMGGMFHDIGLRRVPKEILEKSESQWTPEEAKIFHKHPEWGYEILRSIEGMNDAILLIAMQHHENMRGMGYPQKLKGEKISPLAKITCIADTFCNLVLPRPGRTAMPIEKALMYMAISKKKLFDQKMLNTFITLFNKKVQPK